MKKRNDSIMQLEFFGKITASVTHELNNVLSIINEYAGLLEDQVYMAESGMSINPAKLQSIHGKLIKQVGRGEKIIKNLNKFAHTTDEDIAEFDLNEIIHNLVMLCQRFSSLKRIELKHELSEESINVVSSPFEILRIIFNLIFIILDKSEPSSEISITTSEDNDNITVYINIDPACIDTEEIFSVLCEDKSLEYDIKSEFIDASLKISITFQKKIYNFQQIREK